MGHDPEFPGLAALLDADSIQSQDLYSFFIPSLPTFIHVNVHCFNWNLQLCATISQYFSYFCSHIYHFNGCRLFHHVEIAQFPPVAEGPHPECLVYPSLPWPWAFCNGWVERRERAFGWRVMEKCALKSQQSCNSLGRGLDNSIVYRNCRAMENDLPPTGLLMPDFLWKLAVKS